MWEEGARIYGIPGVHNNFPWSRDRFQLFQKSQHLSHIAYTVKTLVP